MGCSASLVCSECQKVTHPHKDCPEVKCVGKLSFTDFIVKTRSLLSFWTFENEAALESLTKTSNLLPMELWTIVLSYIDPNDRKVINIKQMVTPYVPFTKYPVNTVLYPSLKPTSPPPSLWPLYLPKGFAESKLCPNWNPIGITEVC